MKKINDYIEPDFLKELLNNGWTLGGRDEESDIQKNSVSKDSRKIRVYFSYKEHWGKTPICFKVYSNVIYDACGDVYGRIMFEDSKKLNKQKFLELLSKLEKIRLEAIQNIEPLTKVNFIKDYSF